MKAPVEMLLYWPHWEGPRGRRAFVLVGLGDVVGRAVMRGRKESVLRNEKRDTGLRSKISIVYIENLHVARDAENEAFLDT